jgi:hypothetical protein
VEGAITTPSCATLISPPLDRIGRWLAAGVAGLALVVYIITLAPGLTFEHYGTDGGDLIAAARTLGVPHPTGYPTYTLLAWLFSYLPVGIIAYRVNVLSALCAAGAVGLLCRATQLMFRGERARLSLSVVTALTFAFSPLLWSQAVISEVYALLVFFAALLLWLLLKWRRGGSDGVLWIAAFVLGVGLGNHLTLAFALPAILILLWGRTRAEWHRLLRMRVLLPGSVFFLLGLGIYAYLPLAAANYPPVNWGNPQTWERFLWVVAAKQYQTFAFGLPTAQMLERVFVWSGLLGAQFGWWGLALALVGGRSWWQRDRQFALFSLSWILFVAIYAFTYNTYDSHVYLLPPLLLLALWWGEGARYLLQLVSRWQPYWQNLVLAVFLAMPILSLALNWQVSDLSKEVSVHNFIDQALEGVAPGGLVIVRGDGPTFALWYAIYAEGQRPDVAVISGPLLAYIWYRDEMRRLYPEVSLNEPGGQDVTTDDLVRDLIEGNIGSRPVYATDPAEAWKQWFDFVQEGDKPVFHARPGTSVGQEG